MKKIERKKKMKEKNVKLVNNFILIINQALRFLLFFLEEKSKQSTDNDG